MELKAKTVLGMARLRSHTQEKRSTWMRRDACGHQPDLSNNLCIWFKLMTMCPERPKLRAQRSAFRAKHTGICARIVAIRSLSRARTSFNEM